MLGSVSTSVLASLLGLGLLGPGAPAAADGGPVVDPGPSVRVSVGHTDLPVDRWSWVRVRVRLTEPADELRIDGFAARDADVRVRGVVEQDVDAGRTVLRLPVLLRAHHAVRVVVRAGTTAEHAAQDRTTVRVRPRG